MNIIRKSNYNRPAVNIWDDFFGKDWTDLLTTRAANFSMPAVNVKDGKDQVEVELAAPGLSRDDFKIEVENELLTISAEKEQSNEEKDGEYTRKEFGYSSFKRSFTLPKWVNGDDIKAKYEDGVLRVVVPKKDEAKEKPARLIKVA